MKIKLLIFTHRISTFLAREFDICSDFMGVLCYNYISIHQNVTKSSKIIRIKKEYRQDLSRKCSAWNVFRLSLEDDWVVGGCWVLRFTPSINLLLCLKFFKKFRVGGWYQVNSVFCFGPKLWFWTWTKLNNR